MQWIYSVSNLTDLFAVYSACQIRWWSMCSLKSLNFNERFKFQRRSDELTCRDIIASVVCEYCGPHCCGLIAQLTPWLVIRPQQCGLQGWPHLMWLMAATLFAAVYRFSRCWGVKGLGEGYWLNDLRPRLCSQPKECRCTAQRDMRPTCAAAPSHQPPSQRFAASPAQQG